LDQIVLPGELGRADDCSSLYCATIPDTDMKSLPEMLILTQKTEKSLTTGNNALSIVETEYVRVLQKVKHGSQHLPTNIPSILSCLHPMPEVGEISRASDSGQFIDFIKYSNTRQSSADGGRIKARVLQMLYR
jgi:hypothetical protein